MKSLIKNATYITISSILVKAVAFFYFGFIANILNPVQAGQYFLVLAIFGVLQVLDDLGTTPWLIRHVAGQKSAEELIPHITAIKLVTIPLAIAAAFLAPWALGYSPEVRTLIGLGVFIILADTVSQTNFGVLRGLQSLKYESIGIVIGQTITAVIGATLLFRYQVPWTLIVALGVGSMWNAIFSTRIVLRYISWRAYKPSFAGIVSLVRGSSAFFIANVFTRVFAYADTFLISLLMGEFALGVYSVAYKLTYAFQFVPLALVAALYPALSHEANDDQASLRIVEGALRYLAVIGFPIVGGIYAIAQPLLAVYASAEYQNALQPLQIMIFALIFTFLDYPIGSVLNARMKHAVKTAIMGATLVVNVILNLLLIPYFGLAGASMAAVLSFAFMFTAGFVSVQKVLPIPVELLARAIGIPALASGAMIATVRFSGLNLYLSIVLGALVYGAIVLGTKYMTIAEIRRGFRAQ